MDVTPMPQRQVISRTMVNAVARLLRLGAHTDLDDAAVRGGGA